MKNSSLWYAFWLLILFLSSSCLRLAIDTIQSDLEMKVYWEPADTLSTNHSWDEVQGLSHLFEDHDTVNVFMVHGMRQKLSNHFVPLINSILDQLDWEYEEGWDKEWNGFNPRFKSLIFEDSVVVRDSLTKQLFRANLYEKEFHHTEKGKTIHFFNFFWSGITKPAKDSLNLYNEDLWRTKLAQHVKEYYLIDAIADLALYQNERYRKSILELVKKGTDKLGYGSESPIVFIGGSIGSQILSDFIADSRDTDNDSDSIQAQKIIDRISHIYMLSNQLPFTSLFRTDPSFSLTRDSLAKIVYKNFEPLLENKTKLQLVNFYDPSDVLGFRLPTNAVPIPPGLNVYNVEVHNTLAWKINPHELKRSYLTQIKDNKVLKFSNNLLDLDTERQDIRLNINQMNDGPRYNPDVASFISFGKLSPARIKPIEREPRNKPILLSRKSYPRLAKESTFPYLRGYSIVRAFSLQKLLNKIKKLNITPASQSFDLPDHTSSLNSIKGIRESIEKNEVTRILTIHGMRFKPPEHFDNMAVEIAQKLNFSPIPVIHTRSIYFNGHNGPKTVPHSAIRVLEFTDSQHRKLQFVIVYWAPVTKPVKDFIRDYDASENRIDRAIGPRILKEEIILGGIADVGLSLRGYRAPIEATLDSAFSLLLKNKLTRRDRTNFSEGSENVFFITGSLGTKLIYDFLEKRLDQSNENAIDVMKRLHTFFMLTNPLPLLTLVNNDYNQNGRTFAEEVFGDLPEIANEKTGKKLNIVNFYDPNDILNFSLDKIPADAREHMELKTIYLNIGQGYSINKKHLYKLLKKVDKKMFSMEERDQLKKYVHPNYDELIVEILYKADDADWRRDLKKLRGLVKKHRFVLPHFLKVIELGYNEDLKNRKDPKQIFVVAFDQTHEGVKDDPRIIELLCHGTEYIGRTDPELTVDPRHKVIPPSDIQLSNRP